MNSIARLSHSQLISTAAARKQEFERILAGVPYERKGILNSEMFFLWLCASPFKPRRIFESGRARGQSTLILSRSFPDAEIVSIEYDRHSPDVPVAAQRLADCKNVQQLFGDATKLLPAMVKQGDLVLIDGPKGFRGLRLALSLIGGGKPSIVFMHDTLAGSPERRFLERYLPGTLYSDLPQLAAVTHDLDRASIADLEPDLRYQVGSQHYGYSLAAITRPTGYVPSLTMARAIRDGFVHRVMRSRSA